LRRNSLAALAVILVSATAGAKGPEAFPRADELFAHPLAAPEQFRPGVSIYSLDGRARTEFSLGHAQGLVRGRAGDQLWQWQLDARALAVARRSRGETDAADFLAELPASVRRGDLSFLGVLFHETSRRAGAAPRATATGLRALAAAEPWPWLRAYGGASFLIDTAPSPKRWGLQAGLEAMSGDVRVARGFPVRLYLAEDLTMPERAGFNPNSRLAAGAKISFKDSQRALRVQAGWYSGRSYYGALQSRRERYADFSLILEL
jgi:hypothetical protein